MQKRWNGRVPNTIFLKNGRPQRAQKGAEPSIAPFPKTTIPAPSGSCRVCCAASMFRPEFGRVDKRGLESRSTSVCAMHCSARCAFERDFIGRPNKRHRRRRRRARSCRYRVLLRQVSATQSLPSLLTFIQCKIEKPYVKLENKSFFPFAGNAAPVQ